MPVRARGLPAAGDADRRHLGHHLQLPAVHDAADLRRAREGRLPPRRGGPGPVRRARGGRAAAIAGCDRRRRARGGPRARVRLGVAAHRARRARSSAPTIGWFFVSESFVRVTFPLSLPGVFAGSLLTFIPAIGDYVNAELLGNPDTTMIGNVIQNKFLTQNDYPTRGGPLVHADGRHPGRRRASTPGSSAPRSSRPARGGSDGRRRPSPPAEPPARVPRCQVAARLVGQVPADRLHAAGGHLPAAAGRGHHPVQLQRPGRAEQLHVAGLHAQVLAEPVRGRRAVRGRLA